MPDPDPQSALRAIFASLNTSSFRLSARESGSVEFKESFNWGSKDKYAKTLAAFANNRGGYIIFGVTNAPRRVVGLSSLNFENCDEAVIAAYLNSLFAPELQFEKFAHTVASKSVGVLYVHKCSRKPVVAIKNDNEVKEAEIYYRYNARNDKVKYPELRALIDEVAERERRGWMSLFEKVSRIGPENSAVLDIHRGTIEGDRNSLLIDSKLLPKLKFIKEGQFSEGGKPTLKLIGDVRPIAVTSVRARDVGAMRLTDDPSALAVREEDVLAQFPLDYLTLVGRLKKRYTDFKLSPQFHKIKDKLKLDMKFCRTRYLDPKRQSSGKKDFYSELIIQEFDKHYTQRGS